MIPRLLLKRLLNWRLRKKFEMKASFEYSLWSSGYTMSLDDMLTPEVQEQIREQISLCRRRGAGSASKGVL